MILSDLSLPKASALILGFRLKAKHMLRTDTTFSWYKHCENKHIRFFAQEHSLVLCGCTRFDKEIGNRL